MEAGATSVQLYDGKEFFNSEVTLFIFTENPLKKTLQQIVGHIYPHIIWHFIIIFENISVLHLDCIFP